MIFKTRGIVFRFTKYGETSIIVSIFTEMFGLQSYIVNGIRSKTARNRIALYQPLTLLELEVYHRENANIERIREARCFHPYQSLTSDVRKSTIAIFLSELINKTVKHESHAEELFAFLSGSLIAIDTSPHAASSAHLVFMVMLSRYLGFGPQFVNEIVGGRATDEQTEKVIDQLLHANFENDIAMSNDQRRTILDLLIRFYSEHIDNIGEFRSVQILRDILA